MKKPDRGTVMLVACLMTIMVLGGISAFYYGRTLVSPLSLMAVSLLCGLGVAFISRGFWSWLLRSCNFWLTLLTGGAVCASIFIFSFLCINYCGSSSRPHTETVTVERLYYETRHQSRRVGRRYLPAGSEYKVYYMEVRFAGGRTKRIYLGKNGYGRRRTGSLLEFEMKSGALGCPVITSLTAGKD